MELSILLDFHYLKLRVQHLVLWLNLLNEMNYIKVKLKYLISWVRGGCVCPFRQMCIFYTHTRVKVGNFIMTFLCVLYGVSFHNDTVFRQVQYITELID